MRRFLLCTIIALICSAASPVLAKVPLAKIGKEKVKLEVASTAAQIQRGLMFRQSLPEDAGMVFLFHPPRPVRFWMKNCFIHLDMLFIKDGKIVKIAADTPPCRAARDEDCPLYPSDGEVEVTEVVEVAGGWAKRHGVKEGDTVEFDLPSLSGTTAQPSASTAGEQSK